MSVVEKLKNNSARLRYSAEIEEKGTSYILESQYTNQLERFTLLQTEAIADVDISSLEVGGGDDDFLDFFGDLEESEDSEEEMLAPKDTGNALAQWKAKYHVADRDDALDDDDEYFDDEEDEASKQAASVSAVYEGDVEIKEPDPEALKTNYYFSNRKVVFDYLRRIPQDERQKEIELSIIDPKTGKPYKGMKKIRRIGKYTYGNENEFERLSLLINRVLNFYRNSTNFVSESLVPMGSVFYTQSVFRDGDLILKYTVTNDLTPYCYEYTDLKNDIKVKINIAQKKNAPSPVVGFAKLDLPYKEEILETKKQKDVTSFGQNTYNKTVVFPDPKVFRTNYNLNLGYMDDPDREYSVIDTPNKLIDLVEKKLLPAEILAYDAETQGLLTHKWYSKCHKVVSHSFCWEPGKAAIIPIRMRYCQNIKPEEAAEILRPVLEKKQILAHNGAADVRFNLPDNLHINLTEDTMILIRIIIPFMVKASATKTSRGILKRALDDLVKRAYGWDMIDLDKYVFKPAGIDFDFSLLPYAYLIWYGCPDTDLLLRLWLDLRPKLAEAQEHSYKQVVAYSKSMAMLASYPGIGVNIPGIMEARKDALQVIKVLKALAYKVSEETEQTLPLTSAPKITNYVFGKMGAPLEFAKRTEKKALSADKSVMKTLAGIPRKIPSTRFTKDVVDNEGEVVLKAEELNRCEYPFCLIHRTFADYNKDVTAFLNRLVNNTLEGVYYEFYKCAQTDTYRDTGGIQTTKKKIKYFLGVYNKMYGFSSLDYNTEEFRMAVNLSTDRILINILKDPESDAHTMVAAQLYGLEPSEIDKSLRDPIKSCNFGIIYGMKVRRLTMQLKKTENPTEEELAEVKEIYDKYTYKYEEMLAPLQKSKDFVSAHGWIQNALGYRMIYSQVIDVEDYIDQVFDFSNPTPPTVKLDPFKAYERMGEIMNRSGNYPIQSLAAAQLKDAVITFHKKIIDAGLEEYVFVPLSVHDEVGVIYDKRHVDPYWLFAALHESFYSDMKYLKKPEDLVCPLYIGVGFGTSWGNAKSDLAEFPVAFQSVLLKEFYSNTHPKLTADEDHAQHFSERICTYMKNRVTDMFQHMIDQKEFRRNEMMFEINKNVFLGKKMHELFKTSDEVKDPITKDKKVVVNLDRFIDLILEHNNLNKEDFNIIDGPEFKKEKKENDKLDLFYFRGKEIHPLVKDDGDYLTIDARNIYKPLLPVIANYMRSLHNPERNYHNHLVRFRISNTEMIPVNGVQLVELPITFAEDLNAILAGNNIVRYNSAQPISALQELKSPPILYDCTNRYIIFDLNIINAINPSMIRNVSELISSYLAPKTDTSYQVLFYQNNQYKYTNFYMAGIPNALPEQVKQITRTFGFTY